MHKPRRKAEAEAEAEAEADTAAPLASKTLPEPAPINAKPRPAVGLFAVLTPEQRQAALDYRGPESHGDPTFIKAS